MGWYGCDLDATLCKYAGWVSEHDMGEPVPKMIEIIKGHLSRGEEVRIVTARVSSKHGRSKSTIESVINTIQNWTEKYLGIRLAVTCEKDFGMIWLYDDRVKQVIPNTGELLEDNYNKVLSISLHQHSIINDLKIENERLKTIIEEQNNNRLKLAQSC